jgi:Mce-associated membrane protein
MSLVPNAARSSGPKLHILESPEPVIALTSVLIYIDLRTWINFSPEAERYPHAASLQLDVIPHFARGSAAMTDLLGVAKSPLTQAVEEADAEAAAAIAAAAEARARALRLRRLAEAGAPNPSDPDVTSDVVTAPTDRDEQDEHDEPPETAEVARDGAATRQRWIELFCAALIVLVLCFAGTGSGYILWQHHLAARDVQNRAEFISGARQAVLALMSMSFQNAKENAQHVVEESTGQFRDEFAQHLVDFTKDLVQSKVATTATVDGAAVQAMKGDSATVLLAASSEVTNSEGAQHEPRAWRLIVTMTRDGGKPKMSKLEFLP